MNLVKTSLLNSIAVAIRLVTLFGLNKILAIYVGPVGYAAVGQFQNVIQLIASLSSGILYTGVTKYTAEYIGDEKKQHAVWKTAAVSTLLGVFISSIFVLVLRVELAGWLLKNEDYSDVFAWFSGGLLFCSLNGLLLAIINGKKDIRLFVLANICSSLLSLIFTSALTIIYGLHGALIALAIYQSLAFFVTLWLVMKRDWFSLSYCIGFAEVEILNGLSRFALMAITSAVCVPVTLIVIRSNVVEALGIDSAGYWEAMSRLSSGYLMLITTTLSVYFLPRFSELTEISELKKELLKGYILILPVALIFSFLIFYLRESIISILFSSSFMKMEVMFSWQVFGDFFKIGSWLIAYLIMSKSFVKLYIISEIAFSFLLVLASNLFMDVYGLAGLSMAYAFNYLLYWIFITLAFVVYMRNKNTLP